MASNPYIGDIILFGGNFVPDGWWACDGSLLPISEYTELYNLIGTTYGGDGTQVFAVPDLRGRVPVHQGTGPGLTTRQLGERGGTETVQLTLAQVPSHAHQLTLPASTGEPSTSRTAGAMPGRGGAYSNATADASMAAITSGASGGGQAHDNMGPYLALNFIIALFGIFPAQN